VERKPVLGKGLASLLPSAGAPGALPSFAQSASLATGAGAVAAGEPTTVQQQEHQNKDRHMGISVVLIDDIVANQYQPRRDFDDAALEELAQSIRANGIIQPLVVRKGPNGYQLIAGERRLRAARLAGLKQVPIVIRKSSDREALELALIENIQRQNLNCIDEALAYFQLLQDFSLTQEEVAQRVGKDRATVANYLRLLRLPEAIIEDLKSQALSFGHGKALLGVEDSTLRLRLRDQILQEKLSVRATEERIERLKNPAPQENSSQAVAAPMTALESRLANLSRDLTHQWQTRVEVRGSERRGKIVFHYGSRQELDRILGAMQNEKVWGVTPT
jgi:ParB family chromosome partitioning protein